MCLKNKSMEEMTKAWLANNPVKICESFEYVDTPILDSINNTKLEEGLESSLSRMERAYYDKLSGGVCECCGDVLSRENLLFKYSAIVSSKMRVIYCNKCALLPSEHRSLIKKIGKESYRLVELIKKDLISVNNTLWILKEFGNNYISNEEVDRTIGMFSLYSIKIVRATLSREYFDPYTAQHKFFSIIKRALLDEKNKLLKNKNENIYDNGRVFKKEFYESVKTFIDEECIDY